MILSAKPGVKRAATGIAIAMLMASDPALAGRNAADFTGHYYLQGIYEVGSELLLKPDGHYQWMLAYGAVDQNSEGSWAIDGNELVLTPTLPRSNAPLFKPLAVQPWDVDAEERVQEDAYIARADAIAARCPFLTREGVADSLSPPPMRDATAADRQRLAQAVAAEADARSAYERAAATAMQADGAGRTAAMDAAGTAANAWRVAHDHVVQAASNAHADTPAMVSPALPAACRLTAMPAVQTIGPKAWIRGFSVIVGDPRVGMRFSGIRTVFTYADGHSVERVTDNGGRAWVSYRPAAHITKLTLTPITRDDQPMAAETIPLNGVSEGILPVEIDSGRIMPPPFDTLRLTIDGHDLIGFGGRGRYHREP